MKKRITLIGCLLMVTLAATGWAAAQERWLHVKVVEDGGRGENVNINIPISMIEALLPMIETNEFRDGKVNIRTHIDDDVFEGIDLRKMLEAVRDAPDAEFVTVKSDDENVRVAKEKGVLLINVDSRWDSERVRVKIPLEVVEAMIGENPDEIDLLAGIRMLASYGGGDLVNVESDDSNVRIWIDDLQTSD
jgi:hypothetical protein